MHHIVIQCSDSPALLVLPSGTAQTALLNLNCCSTLKEQVNYLDDYYSQEPHACRCSSICTVKEVDLELLKIAENSWLSFRRMAYGTRQLYRIMTVICSSACHLIYLLWIRLSSIPSELINYHLSQGVSVPGLHNTAVQNRYKQNMCCLQGGWGGR